MELLRKSLISSTQPYREGAVAVFEQRFSASANAKLTITALGIYGYVVYIDITLVGICLRREKRTLSIAHYFINKNTGAE